MSKVGKVLVVTSKYHVDILNPYLTNDLVNELAEHTEKVIVVGYGEMSQTIKTGNIEAYIIGMNSKVKFLKYFWVWPLLFLKVLSVLFQEKKITHLIMFAPLSVLWPAALLTRFVNVPKKTAIIFDIFPIHQVQIGSIPSFISSFAKKIERFLLSGFNKITAMGHNNKKCIENYYTPSIFGAEVCIVPLWSPKSHFNKEFSFKNKITKLVFGGQIIKGREIETMIEHLNVLYHAGLNISLDLYSTGADFEFLKDKYSDIDWIFFKDQIAREEYFKMLSQYDVGLIVTDRRVTLPTFPSKILDYARAGLASYCLVEAECDLYSVARGTNIIHLNYFDFSSQGLESSLHFFNKLKVLNNEELKAEFSILNEHVSIDSAVLKLLQ